MPIYVQKIDSLHQNIRDDVIEEKKYIELYVYTEEPSAGVIISSNYDLRVSVYVGIEVIKALYASTVIYNEQTHNELIKYNIKGTEYSRWIEKYDRIDPILKLRGSKQTVTLTGAVYKCIETDIVSPKYVAGSHEANQLIADVLPSVNYSGGVGDLLLDLQLG